MDQIDGTISRQFGPSLEKNMTNNIYENVIYYNMLIFKIFVLKLYKHYIIIKLFGYLKLIY